jgi:uncharacterized protein YndB with AHSA1/START domain
LNSDVTISEAGLEITHILNVPTAEAFTWWSQQAKLQQWSGCAEATRCEIAMDFRVGGTFQQTMDIAGRGTFTFHGVYDEIVEPEQIAWRAFFGPVTTRMVVQFFAMGDRTRVVLTQTGFPDAQSLKTIRQGTEESLLALDGILARTATRATPAVMQ